MRLKLKRVASLALVGVLAFSADALAGRGGFGGGARGGGFGGGGMRGGGGFGGGGFSGGARPAGGMGGGFNRTPSMSMPRPNVGGGGGMNRPAARPSFPSGGGAGMNRPATRPSLPSGGAGNRPNLPGGGTGIGNRPNLPGGGTGIGNRPNLPSGGLNRPGVGGDLGVGQRPGVGGQTNIFDRPGIGDRPGISQLPSNRPGVGGGNNIVNRPGGGNNVINRDNINNINRPVDPGYNQPWNNRPGWGYHQGWVNGYWHGANNNWWNNWGGFATGMAVGGLAGWGVGSAYSSWGYMPYTNPYYAEAPVVVQQPVVAQDQPIAALSPGYDYSQPLDTSAAPPDEATADPALSQFDNARALFKQGDYPGALAETDAALKSLPNDAAMHEFRALCLFAMGKYTEAAGVLYAVLSVGPGWDWTTLIGLYPSIDVYTTQLRALEDYSRANPDDPASRFVLGYHYLTQGHTENAQKLFQKVAELQPKDTLSAALAKQLGGAAAPPTEGAPPPAQPQPAAAGPAPKIEDLKGAPWTASPVEGVSIALTLGTDDTFTWNVTQKGQSKPISGQFTYADGMLTLAQTGGPALVGKLSSEGAGFRFQAMGGGGGDPGLLFQR